MIFTFLYSAVIIAVGLTGVYELMEAIDILLRDDAKSEDKNYE